MQVITEVTELIIYNVPRDFAVELVSKQGNRGLEGCQNDFHFFFLSRLFFFNITYISVVVKTSKISQEGRLII